MEPNKGLDFESIIFEYIDKIRYLLNLDQWSSIFLDFSKNELWVLLFLYRNKSANMTQISEYIGAPLNTTTGIVGRLENKLMVERKRDDNDRRVVNIIITRKANEFIEKEKKIIEYFFKEVYKALTDEEKIAAINIFNKFVSVLIKRKDNVMEENKSIKKVKRIIIE
ncbi:transcriptional repressor MprA [Clostridium homopropionicum DSM 5847]|uniref:Transcriptional repressor MprA n=1 Tax=Clostridium homopropionicum DSM 5847 TaxID=1121318 RepID=A0A0L6ZCQ4_9CLOT|nr:MarR family transcriptional regulator [Clostridium homopropionicum]KOA20722.1 transcriptional repressor MprA [Clostridium homopropionicum DSM 5847]SFF90689.1 transcriptional regulator, MarR family [Clostridium homopropionicum]